MDSNPGNAQEPAGTGRDNSHIPSEGQAQIRPRPHHGPTEPSDEGERNLPTKEHDLALELEAQKQLYKHAEKAMDERQELLNAERKINKELTKNLDELREKLQRAYDHMFLPQPQRTDITEAEASEQFRAIFKNADKWVQNWLDPVLEKRNQGELVGKARPGLPPQLPGLVRPPAPRYVGGGRADECYVLIGIMQKLKRKLFNKSFRWPLGGDGTEAEAVKYIDMIADAMAKLPRGMSSRLIIVCCSL